MISDYQSISATEFWELWCSYRTSLATIVCMVVDIKLAILFVSGLMQLAAAWLQYRAITPSGIVEASKGPYTWLDNNYPNALEIDLGDNVALTIEDSRHYALDSEDADAEWQSIYPGTSNGFVRLGPQRRFFGLSVYHQIHCLDSLRWAILGRQHSSRSSVFQSSEQKRDVPHAHHCLNYLRQTILCNADLTLEPEVIEGSNDVGEGLGVTHVCRDWSKIHRFVENNARDFEEWKSNRTRS